MNNLRWILPVLLSLHAGNGQPGANRAGTLIRTLTLQRDMGMGFSSCGSINTDRVTAKSLADIGRPATAQLESALDSIEKLGDKSPFMENVYWLSIAYASIQGPAAFPRFRRMGSKRKLGITMDNAMALSLSLTSVVSSTRYQGRHFRCRREEPRDALDQLILDWEIGNRENREYPPLAVGYHFEIPGFWSDPPESVRPEHREVGPLTEQERVEIETTFHKLSGGECARTRVIFRKVSSAHTIDAYVVDEESGQSVRDALAVCVTPLKEAAKSR